MVGFQSSLALLISSFFFSMLLPLRMRKSVKCDSLPTPPLYLGSTYGETRGPKKLGSTLFFTRRKQAKKLARNYILTIYMVTSRTFELELTSWVQSLEDIMRGKIHFTCRADVNLRGLGGRPMSYMQGSKDTQVLFSRTYKFIL